MKVMRVNPVSANSNYSGSSYKSSNSNPSFNAKVQIPTTQELDKTMFFYTAETRIAMAKAFNDLKTYFSNKGSKYLNISLNINDNSIASTSGNHYLDVWGKFDAGDEALDYLIKKYGFAIKQKHFDKLTAKDKDLTSALSQGASLYSDDVAFIKETDFKSIYKPLITSDYPPAFVNVMKNTYKEDAEGKIFKDIISENTGWKKFVKDWLL